MANVPADLKYTREHEWAKQEGDRVRVGITAYAQEQLGDVVFVELPKVGAKVTASQELRRRRVGEGGLRPLRADLGRGRRGQRRAAAEAGDGQPGPVRQGLDDRRRSPSNKAEWDQLLTGAAVRGVPRAGRPLMPSRYIANTPEEQKRMLGVIGAASLEDLLVKIPAKARLARPLASPAGARRDRPHPPPAGAGRRGTPTPTRTSASWARARTITTCRARSTT